MRERERERERAREREREREWQRERGRVTSTHTESRARTQSRQSEGVRESQRETFHSGSSESMAFRGLGEIKLLWDAASGRNAAAQAMASFMGASLSGVVLCAS